MRAGCRLYHTLINQLTVYPFNKDANFLHIQLDNSVCTLVRSQHVLSIVGHTLTGGLDEPVFEIHHQGKPPPLSRDNRKVN
jgi:hypothetical protein